MRKLLVVLVLLGLAAVAADRVAHKLAADEAEQRLAAEGLEEPAVTVRGFPFLTQLAAREFDDVDVTARLVRTGNGRARRVEAHGHDVRVPSGGDVVVGRLEATGTVPYAEVERRLGRPGLSLSAAGDGQVRLRSDVPVPGGTLAVTARGEVRVRGTRVRLVPAGLRLQSGGTVPGSVSALLRDRLSVRFQVPGLPDGVRVERVTAAASGFVVDVAGADLTLGSGSLAG
jgi:hypothetical protein